jgi:hypothetical protein
VAVTAGDTLVLYIGPDRPIVAERLTSPVDESSVVQRLEQIASLRLGEGGTEGLQNASLHADPAVAQYSLKRLLGDPQVSVPDQHFAQLRQARDDESSDPGVRLLAAELTFQREGKDRESDEAYQWLQTAITQSTAADWTQIAPFVRRLVAIDRRRSDTVAFLTRLATDEQVPEPVRIAAYSGFEDVIDRVSPQEAQRIIDACFQMLQSQNPVVRQAGASLLYNFSVRGGPGPLEGLATRAAEALRSAQTGEADEQVRGRLERLTQQLSGQTIE